MAEFNFENEYPGKVDSKGRIVLPVKHRNAMIKADELAFVVRKGFYDDCLMAYPESEWRKLMKRFTKGGDPMSRKIMDIKRRLTKGSARIEYSEDNGRMNIPRTLLEYAGISKDVVITGLDNYIEIWDKKKYEAIDANSDDFAADFENVLSELPSLHELDAQKPEEEE